MIKLVFDCLRSPYDFANVIQVALALKDCEIYVTGSSLDYRHPKVSGKVASWSSRIKRGGFPDDLKILYFDSLESCVRELREKGLKIIGTSPHAKRSFYEVDFDKHDSAIVFGTEVGGLSKTKTALMDDLVKIPMSSSLDFMTLSIVVPIVAYEIRRRENR